MTAITVFAGCGGSKSALDAPPPPAVQRRQLSVDNLSAVKQITIDGGGHTWFAPAFGPTNGAVDATQEIWSFLAAVRRS